VIDNNGVKKMRDFFRYNSGIFIVGTLFAVMFICLSLVKWLYGSKEDYETVSTCVVQPMDVLVWKERSANHRVPSVMYFSGVYEDNQFCAVYFRGDSIFDSINIGDTAKHTYYGKLYSVE
jgi:hypothetical protein